VKFSGAFMETIGHRQRTTFQQEAANQNRKQKAGQARLFISITIRRLGRRRFAAFRTVQQFDSAIGALSPLRKPYFRMRR